MVLALLFVFLLHDVLLRTDLFRSFSLPPCTLMLLFLYSSLVFFQEIIRPVLYRLYFVVLVP